MTSLHLIHDASDPIGIRPALSTSPCLRKNPMTSRRFSDDEEEADVRRSTGSLTGRSDWQRHTFAAVPSSLIEHARRSTEELGSQSLPPRSAPSSTSRTGAHIQHLRVYGRPRDSTGNDQVGEHEQAGEPFLETTNPDSDTMWIRGKAAAIEWHVIDANVEHVQIELLEYGSVASTIICKGAPNNGGFLYTKVPWGMACGDNYFLRISSSSDPSRYMTTCAFSIGSDP